MEGKEESLAKRRTAESGLSSTGVTNSLTEDMANIGGPTLLKRTLGLQNDRYSQYIGPTTDFEPSLIDLSPFDPQDESLLSRGTLRKVSDVDTFLLLPDYTTPGHEHQIDDVDAIEDLVAPHGPVLLDLYFRIIHPNFPILQKNVFLEKYNRSYREFSPPLLAAVYILAINWWEHSDELSNLPRPDVKELERLARVTLSDAMYRPKLSTVQAGLLLSQAPEGDQWAPTAQLVAISQELGLHLDCSNWKIPPWERGLRKRLAWALYMQDKWGALVHGRPSHIFATNWAVLPLSPNDFPEMEHDESNSEESAEYERGRLLFTQMIILSQILSEVLDTFYTLSAMSSVAAAGPQGTHLVLQLAKPVQLKLKEWYSALPPCLRMDAPPPPSSPSSPKERLSSTGFLHLAYFATEITLHRRIIRSLTPSPSSSSSTTHIKTETPTPAPQVEPYIHHICRSAAKTRLISAMDFVNRLTTSHLRAFWYFASKTNFALIGTFGSLLWATAPGREEADWYRRRLGEYRWTLGVSCKTGSGNGSSGLTRFAMGMLDTSTGLLKGLPEKPALTRVASEGDASAGAMARRTFVAGSLPSVGTGFSIGGRRREDVNGNANGNGVRNGAPNSDDGVGMHSGLVSPSTSVSSSTDSRGGYEGYMVSQTRFAEEDY
ncbi:fungal specific transcription factor domain-containing protein [Rutstroemia sp. NJR-2017a WRK4]|nr:fungal specific transcription factor domain-containing protein [Rutstroemia sp. NJR-2017a WRK4]